MQGGTKIFCALFRWDALAGESGECQVVIRAGTSGAPMLSRLARGLLVNEWDNAAPAGVPEEVPMNETKRRRTASETEERLRRGVGEEIVTLEDGDPLEAAETDAADWDWDTDGLAGDRHCAACGAWGPVFRLDDGTRVCASCVHGKTPAS